MASLDSEPGKGQHGEELSNDSNPLDSEKTDVGVGADDSTDDYVHGARLAIIMLALMLGTFLIALDNVSDRASTKAMQANSIRDRPLLGRQFRKSRTSSTVWTR